MYCGWNDASVKAAIGRREATVALLLQAGRFTGLEFEGQGSYTVSKKFCAVQPPARHAEMETVSHTHTHKKNTETVLYWRRYQSWDTAFHWSHSKRFV